MIEITAPSKEIKEGVSVFLGGGITNCPNWQSDVISKIDPADVILYNPRQRNFDITDESASEKQIKWEFERLEVADIFSMYFCGGVSDQPICMYELGRNVVRMQNRFPDDWEKRIVVSVEHGYKRKQDVRIQLQYCAPGIYVDIDSTTDSHARRINDAVKGLLLRGKTT